MRPAIACVATLAMDPYVPLVGGIVRSREVRFGQLEEPAGRQRILERGESRAYWSVGGTVRGKEPTCDGSRLKLLEQGLEVAVQPDGQFTIGHLQPGVYTLEITAEGREATRHRIAVPSPDYELEV